MAAPGVCIARVRDQSDFVGCRQRVESKKHLPLLSLESKPQHKTNEIEQTDCRQDAAQMEPMSSLQASESRRCRVATGGVPEGKPGPVGSMLHWRSPRHARVGGSYLLKVEQ